MFIRKSTKADIPQIAEIYADAKKFMRENRNPNQWNKGYPNAESAELDIDNEMGYVCEDEDGIVAVFAFCPGVEKTYDKIYEGEWLNTLPYAYIHRIAVKRHGCGIVDFCFSECFKMFPNLKIDTHRDNIPMQKVLSRNGFSKCGIIYLESGEERFAYQKTNKGE